MIILVYFKSYILPIVYQTSNNSRSRSRKWVKNNREFVEYEAVCHDPDGNKIFVTRRSHALDFLTIDVPKAATGIDSGAGGRLG